MQAVYKIDRTGEQGRCFDELLAQVQTSQAYVKRNFHVGGFFIRSCGVVLVSVVLQLCEQVASIEESLSHGAQQEGHGYYSGHTEEFNN